MIIVPVSGGWDSALVWLYTTGILRDGYVNWSDTNAVAVFTDTHKEHPRTYVMLDTLDAMTGRPIIRLRGPTWEDALEPHHWFLPWWRARWCTPTFKIKPFQKWVGDSVVTSRIGLRADEQQRVGYLGDRGNNITPQYILRDMGITFDDRERLANEVGLPPPGPWSCGCCPLRPHIMWVRTVEECPHIAEWSAWVEEEKKRRGGSDYGWCRGFKIRELINDPQLRTRIRTNWWARNQSEDQMVLWDDLDEEERPCLMCQVK